MKRIILVKLAAVAFIIAGCKKIDIDEPVNGEPVFYAQIEVNGVDSELEAGVDDFYMFTGYEKDSNEVYVFTGSLRKQNCNSDSCGPSLSIFIRDSQQTPFGIPDVENALKPGSYQFTFSGNDTAWVYDTSITYQATFNASSSTLVPNSVGPYYWEFGDGTQGQGVTPVHIYSEEDSIVQVTLKLPNNNFGCSSSQTQGLNLAGLNPATACSVFVDTVVGAGTNTIIGLKAIASGVQPFAYIWNNPLVTSDYYPLNNTFSVASAVTVTDSNGCTASSSYNAMSNPGVNTFYCSARFNVESVIEQMDIDSTQVLVSNSFQFSTVTINYTDSNGETYSSGHYKQSPTSFFEIISAGDFEENEEGARTKKLHVRFACELIGNNGAVVSISSEDTVIGVSYPD